MILCRILGHDWKKETWCNVVGHTAEKEICERCGVVK